MSKVAEMAGQCGNRQKGAPLQESIQCSYRSPRGYVDHKKQFLFFHSRKAGCTAVWRWFSRNNPALITAADPFQAREDPVYSFRSLSFIAAHLHYKKVLFVRDPVERAVSTYYEKFVRKSADLGVELVRFDQLEPFAKHLVSEIAKDRKTEVEPYTGISFEDYLGFLTRHIRDTNLNVHWRPQMILPNLSYDVIDVLDNMNIIVNEILNPQFGYVEPMTYANQNNLSAAATNAGYVGNIVSAELAKRVAGNSICYSYDDFLNVKNVEAITRLYKEDFEVYNRLKAGGERRSCP